MKLFALSDIHVGHAANRRAIAELPAQPDAGLILAGDLCESEEDFLFVLDTLGPRYKQLFWVPGNHELWTTSEQGGLRGQAKYLHFVSLCQERGVLTPEDPYLTWPGEPQPYLIAPLFLLYDYSFSPQGMSVEQALDWAFEEGLICADERYLHADPYASKQAWCAARCRWTEQRLEAALQAHDGPTVLINHFPLRREHAVLPAIPRFRIWCGTTQSERYHERFRAEVVVFGHLHIRHTRKFEGTRFEEVSLGYPAQWRPKQGAAGYLRQILPAPGS